MKKLSGKHCEKLVNFMIQAYSDISDLEQIVRFQLDESLDEIAKGQTNREIIFKLITWAESRGNLKKLLEAVYQDRPNLQDNIKELLEIYFRENNKPFIRYEISPYHSDDEISETLSNSEHTDIFDNSPFDLKSQNIWTFTARQTEFQHLERLLIKSTGQQRCSVVGISGIGGVGKTALACYFAERNYQQHFPDGVICLRVDDKSLMDIALEFASYYPIKIDDRDKNRGASHIMQRVFKNKKALLIFDNAEDSEIKALFPKFFQDKYSVIVTTRDQLLISSLSIPFKGRFELRPFSPPDSWKLLENLVGEQRLQDEQQAVERIIELVGNLPLALNIIGNLLIIEDSITEYEAFLRQEKQRLLDAQVNEKEINVRASLELSLNLLKKRNQESTINFFACLSVCPKDGFSLYAAKVVSGLPEENTLTHLRNLRQLSLIEGSKNKQTRYSFHPLIHVFAQDLLIKTPQLEQQAKKRHAHYYLNFTKRNNLKNQKIESILKTELNNIILVAKWLQEEENADYDFASHMIRFFQIHNYWKEAVEFISIFLSLAHQYSHKEHIIKLCTQKATYLWKLGERSKAREVIDSIKNICNEINQNDINSYKQKSAWLNTRAVILQKQGYLDEAIENLKSSIEIKKELSDQLGLSISLNTLAGLYRKKSDLDKALRAYQDTLEIKKEIIDEKGKIMTLTSISHIYIEKKQFDKAIEVLEECANFERKIKNLSGLAMVLNNLGIIYRKQEKFDKAIEVFGESAKLKQQLGDVTGLSKTYHQLGITLREKKDLTAALRYFELSIKVDKGQKLSIVYTEIAKTFLKQGKITEAAIKFRESFEIEEKLKFVSGLETVLPDLVETLIKLGQKQEAINYCKRALTIDSQNRDFIQIQKQLLKS